jgi:hypothetical protein
VALVQLDVVHGTAAAEQPEIRQDAASVIDLHPVPALVRLEDRVHDLRVSGLAVSQQGAPNYRPLLLVRRGVWELPLDHGVETLHP